MPDLGKYHVPRPKSGKTVYIFHSLNSTHTAYREGAFDGFDQFLCTGPHHVEELLRLRENSEPELSKVGYHKLDLIREEHEEYAKGPEAEVDLVLLAPSWGRANLLEAHGADIIKSLLASGFKVIVRPHPQFFHSLYREGSNIVASLQAQFGSQEHVEFELSIDSQDSFHKSALMISDWSGAAYEYALGTLRPVLFIDTPQKIFNPGWERIGLPSFEKAMRAEVGSVVPLAEVDAVGVTADKLISGDLISSGELADLADSVVFNPGAGARAGAAAIAKCL
jgi:YidC/Oxa1 family membrane protein insertase